MKIFGRDKERVLRILIANLNSLSQVDDDQLSQSFTQKSHDFIKFMFKMIKNNEEITSDLTFSAYLFLSKNCNDDQCENGFEAIPTKIKDYLKKCVDEFNKNNQEDLDKERKERDLIIGKEKFKKLGFYVLDVDNCGIATTLNVILDSLAHLASKNTKKINFKSLIYQELKGDLDIVLEKGSTGEKRLVLEIYKHLACDQEIEQKLILSKGIKKSILESDDFEKILKTSFRNLLIFLDQNYETKNTVCHDNYNENKKDFILLGFSWTNEKQSVELANKLKDNNLNYSVILIDIEGM